MRLCSIMAQLVVLEPIVVTQGQRGLRDTGNSISVWAEGGYFFIRWSMLKQECTWGDVYTVVRPMCTITGFAVEDWGLAWIARASVIFRKYSWRSLSRRWWAYTGWIGHLCLEFWWDLGHVYKCRSNQCVGYE